MIVDVKMEDLEDVEIEIEIEKAEEEEKPKLTIHRKKCSCAMNGVVKGGLHFIIKIFKCTCICTCSEVDIIDNDGKSLPNSVLTSLNEKSTNDSVEK